MATGLYDPAYEHDACGVGMVADLHGRPDHDIVDRGLTVLERLAHRGASGAEVDTGRRRRHPRPGPAPLPGRGAAEAAGFTLPDGRRLRRGPRLPCPATPTTPRRPGPSSSRRRPRRAWRCSAGARCPSTPRAWARPPWVPCRCIEQLFVVGAGRPGRQCDTDGARAAGLRAAQAGRARGRRPLLPLALGPHHRLQGHADLRPAAPSSSPTWPTRASSRAWPWCTPASRPTPSRAGPWPTPTATWPTTARSTRWPATATGCGPARPCSRHRPHRRRPGPGLPDRARPGPATRPASTRCSSCSTWAGARCHHAVLMMIPEAWENHRTMDPARRAFYRYHASLMEPWDGPAAVAFTDGTVVGAVLDRNGLRPARYWVTDDGLVVLASEVGVLDIAPDQRRAQGPPAARPDVPGRHRPRAGIVDDDEIKADAGRRAPLRRLAGATTRSDLDELPPRTMLTPQHGRRRSRQQRLFGYTDRGAPADPGARWPAPGPSRSAPWARTPPSPCSRTAPGCSTTTSPSCSPR